MNTAVSIEIDVTNRSFHDHFIVLSQSLLKTHGFTPRMSHSVNLLHESTEVEGNMLDHHM